MLPNTKETVFIDGPLGQLEALVTLPKSSDALKGAAVVCHPHPLKEGTMHNKVVHFIAKTFNDCGYGAVRFNYRGVGQSSGKYGEGIGESEDALAVMNWTQDHINSLPLWLAGFSFGGYVALRCSTQKNIRGLITVAPAVNLLDFQALQLPSIPWQMIHGDEDDVVPFNDAAQWYDGLSIQPQLDIMNGAGHFFHGRLNELREHIKQFILAQS